MTGSQFNPLWSVFGEVLSASTGVFYHILTHTWPKETTQPNLLDLFDRYGKKTKLSMSVTFSHCHRLSDRVAYEQQLADTYLHTCVARDSLGQACHQYLIQPLAKTFTNDGEQQ